MGPAAEDEVHQREIQRPKQQRHAGPVSRIGKAGNERFRPPERGFESRLALQQRLADSGQGSSLPSGEVERNGALACHR